MGNSLITEQVKLPSPMRYDGEYTVELENVSLECWYIVHQYPTSESACEVEILSINVSLGGAFVDLPMRALGPDLLRVLEDEVQTHVENEEVESRWERKR